MGKGEVREERERKRKKGEGKEEIREERERKRRRGRGREGGSKR